jgi:ferritin-like metal-binding protein YciE
MDSLRELFIQELQDIYDAENQLVKALPKMAKAASSTELRSAFQNHLEQTKEHIERIETIFEGLDEEPEGKPCKGMAGLIAEGKEALEEDMEDDLRDAALIAAAQRVEHYEIAAYGTAKSFASLLDEREAADLLDQTLNEEKEADQLLSEVSEEVNARACGESVTELERAPMRRAKGKAPQPARQQAKARRKR